MIARCKSIEVRQGSAVHHRMADLDDPTEPDEVLVINLVTSE